MCLTLTIILSLYALLRYATRVYMRFRLPSQDVITGRFSSNEVTPGACTSSLMAQNQHRPTQVDRGAPSR